jgi:hypothetical protein
MVCWLLGVKVVHNGNSYTPRQTIGSHLSPAGGGGEGAVGHFRIYEMNERLAVRIKEKKKTWGEQ